MVVCAAALLAVSSTLAGPSPAPFKPRQLSAFDRRSSRSIPGTRPGVADENFMLANAYARLGRLKQAEDALERGLEFAPRDAEARRMLDEIRRAAGPTVK